jgi:hypothetical protein
MNFPNNLTGTLKNDVKAGVNRAKSGLNNAQRKLTAAENQLKTLKANRFNSYFIVTDEQDGYEFIETSPNWKRICSALPCSTQDWWADYVTTYLPTTLVLGGQPRQVIIQLWKGWCQRLGGRKVNGFPGGIGAEVGIYQIVSASDASNGFSGSHWIYGPTKDANAVVSSVRQSASQLVQSNSMLNGLTSNLPRRQCPYTDPNVVWYPIPRPWPRLQFSLSYSGNLFFQTKTEETYWLTRWMDPTDYHSRYKKNHPTPECAANYTLHYSVNGIPYSSW